MHNTFFHYISEIAMFAALVMQSMTNKAFLKKETCRTGFKNPLFSLADCVFR